MNDQLRMLSDRRRLLAAEWDVLFGAGRWDAADEVLAEIRDVSRAIAELVAPS